jgi:hypothetical protein
MRSALQKKSLGLGHCQSKIVGFIVNNKFCPGRFFSESGYHFQPFFLRYVIEGQARLFNPSFAEKKP